MDESLRRAAGAGDVRELYRLIGGDGNLLRRFDDVEFIDTPLHIAASEGWIDFAMEIMNLKPSFAWKLNQQGLSPIHLAVKKGHKQLVLRLQEMNKDLVRVKGKKGKTPLHYLCKVGNGDELLTRILEACPEYIRDVTTKNQTALHIAVKNNRLDVLKVLIRTLRKTEYREEVVNRKDKYDNTVLHIAAINNEPEILQLLLKCKADKHLTNKAGSTALEVANQLNNRESISILQGFPFTRVSTMYCKLQKQTRKHVTRASSIIFHDMDNISSDDRNALLVILGLLLTATFQASLSPPGGVWQGDNYSNSTSLLEEEKQPGRSVLEPFLFLIFFVPACTVFMVTFFLILALLKPYPHGFRTAVQVLLAFLAICFEVAVSFIATTHKEFMVIQTISLVVFIIMMFMCIALRVSKISVLILGFWLIPAAFYPNYTFVGSLIVLCWLFFFLYDEFWKGTVLTLVYYLFASGIGYQPLEDFGVVIGCWFFLSLSRFCMQRLNFLYTKWVIMTPA